MLPKSTYAAFGSQELLLSGNHSADQTATVFHPKRSFKPSNKERYLRKTISMLNLQEVKGAPVSRVCQRLATSQMICGERLLPSISEQEKISSLPADMSNKKLTVYEQSPTTGKSQALQDKKSQPEKELEIGSLKIINSLNTINSGEGVWKKFAHSIFRCCSDANQWTNDEEWFDYVDEKIKVVDRKPETFWNLRPSQLKTLIQEIIFITLKTLHRYKGLMSEVNPEHLKNLDTAIQKVLKQYYQRFGEELFWQILNPKTYTKKKLG